MKKIPLLAACLFFFSAATVAAPANNAKVNAAVEAAVAQSWPSLTIQEQAFLEQDENQKLCALYKDQPPKKIALAMEQTAQKSIQYHAPLMGDWQKGQAIAKSAHGLRRRDDPNKPNGGNCYACHQIEAGELAAGNMGPSLHQYGKLRGVSFETVQYTYEKIYNAQSHLACSKMQRFGYHRFLTPAQVADLTAYLLKPESPVNK